MDDSDMEILGIPNKKSSNPKSPNQAEVNKTSKKSVREKLMETEAHHQHRTAVSKSSHTRKKRRKSHAERNKERARSSRMKTRGASELQKHMKLAKEISSSRSEHPQLQPSGNPLITQNRITTCLGIYNKSKKSDMVIREVTIPHSVREAAKDNLKKILDVSDANIPPAVDPNLLLSLDNKYSVKSDVVGESVPTPKVQIYKSESTVKPSTSHVHCGQGIAGHSDDALDLDNPFSDGHLSGHDRSPAISPISEAAEMIHSSYDLNTVFPGKSYLSKVKDSLKMQLQKQMKTCAIQTPRKSHVPVKHHSAVRKNLNLDFTRRSGSSIPRSRSTERNQRCGEVVKRSDLVARDESVPQSGELPGCSSSTSHAPRTATTSTAIGLKPGFTNLFEECVLTLQNQPTMNNAPPRDFFPNVETQRLPTGHTLDMLDYIHLSCSQNDSFSYSDPHSIQDGLICKPSTALAVRESTGSETSTVIYPRHLDPGLPFAKQGKQMARNPDMSYRSDFLTSDVRYLREKYEQCSSSSGEDKDDDDDDDDLPGGQTFTLPPPLKPILPPSSPSPPTMYRQRMY